MYLSNPSFVWDYYYTVQQYQDNELHRIVQVLSISLNIHIYRHLDSHKEHSEMEARSSLVPSTDGHIAMSRKFPLRKSIDPVNFLHISGSS
jgi:hypothetical protein